VDVFVGVVVDLHGSVLTGFQLEKLDSGFYLGISGLGGTSSGVLSIKLRF
jgi:hypothetical protein